MNCKNTLKLISKYFDKQTDSNLNNILFDHINNCPGCKKEFDILNKIYSKFPEKKVIKLNPYFNQKLKTYIFNKQNKLFKIPIFKPARMFFTFATLLFVLTFTLIKTVPMDNLKPNILNVSKKDSYDITVDEDIVIFGLIELASEINNENYILKEEQ
jgi:thiol-disulfide isomerase/thioredoxin